jgi:hypothetical protein
MPILITLLSLALVILALLYVGQRRLNKFYLKEWGRNETEYQLYYRKWINRLTESELTILQQLTLQGVEHPESQIPDKPEMKMLVRETVCASCLSPHIIDKDCVCTYMRGYPVVELEFEKCACCDNVSYYPAETEFNNQQYEKHGGANTR